MSAKHIESAPIIPCCPSPHNRFKNLVGQKFNRLLVESLAGKRLAKSGTYDYFWNCLCDCSKNTIVRTSHLKAGLIKSCGCLNIEIAMASNTTHGMHDSPGYCNWKAMVDRCTNPDAKHFLDYGG